MQIHQQILTAKIDQQPHSINSAAKTMIETITKQIKLNRSSRKNSHLVYELSKSDVKFPDFYNKEKTMTKWERFAKKKGLKFKSKSKMVWDEELQKFLPTWGSNSKKNLILRGGVVDIKGKTLSKLKKEKKLRIEKNNKSRENNLKRLRNLK